VPRLGAGAIYQVAEADIVIPDFAIPEFFLEHTGLTLGGRRQQEFGALATMKPE